MSAIYDYVHLKAENYMKHGIKRPSSKISNINVLSELGMKRKQVISQAKMRTIHSSAELQSIENQLNGWNIVLAKLANNQDAEAIRTLIMNELLFSYVPTAIQSQVTSANFDFSTGTVNIPSIQKTKNLQQTSFTWSSTIVDRFKKSFAKIEEWPDAATKEKLQTMLQFYYSLFNKYVQDLSAASANVVNAMNSSKLNSPTAQSIQGASKSVNVKIDPATAESFIKSIQSVEALISVSNLPTILGNFEEAIIGVCAKAIEGYSLEDIHQALQSKTQLFGGQSTVKIEMKTDLGKLSSKVLKELKDETNARIVKSVKNSEYTDTYELVFSGVTKTKADVTMTWKSKKDKHNGNLGKQLGLSIKNTTLTNSSGKVSLVSGSPLIYFLLGWNDKSLATHMLNILAAHTDESTVVNFDKARKIGVETLAYMILYSSLSGQNVGRSDGFANLFLINDRNAKSGQNIKIYDIGQIMSYIIKNEKLNQVYINGKNSDTNQSAILTDLRLVNDKIVVNDTDGNPADGVGIQMRLTKLLFNAHREKVKCAISKNILKEIHT